MEYRFFINLKLYETNNNQKCYINQKHECIFVKNKFLK